MRTTNASPARVLLDVADRLTAIHPDRPMDEGALLILSQRATDPAVLGHCAAERLARAARRMAPVLDRPITRGEYALLLRKAAKAGGCRG